MLSNLKSQLNEVNEENVWNVLVLLKVWVLCNQNYVGLLRDFDERAAQLSLINSRLSWKVDAMAYTEIWSPSMRDQFAQISNDLAMMEADLKNCVSLFNEDVHGEYMLKISIEHLLS